MRTTIAALGTALVIVALSLLATVLERPIYLLMGCVVAGAAIVAMIYSEVSSPTRRR